MPGPVARRHRDPDAGRVVEMAVRYAAHGWPVMPLHTPRPGGCSCRQTTCSSVGKHPRNRRGLLAASTDREQVRAWWARWPHANLGVVTGSASGLLVVDVDLPDGPASLARLQSEHGRLPATCTQRTGSGGFQMLFTHPVGVTVGNRARVWPGIDLRGDGGYIVVPPSRHATGDRYRWTRRIAPVDPPGWLLAALDRTRHGPSSRAVAPPPSPPSTAGAQGYADAALHRELAELATAADGARNHALNRAAFNLGQLVAAGLLDHDHVVGELRRVAAAVARRPASHPFTKSEIDRTIASGLSAGARRPRPAPPPTPSARQVAGGPVAAIRHAVGRHR